MISIRGISAGESRSVVNKKQCPSFKGMRLPDKVINNASDAIEMWNLLAKSKYTALENDVFSSGLNKKIQKFNFSFLDKLTKYEDKITFIDYFKKVTGFPDLQKVSKKIVDMFNTITDNVEKTFSEYNLYDADSKNFFPQPAHIVLRGHNIWSSVNSEKALPGSDLNGAFLLFRGAISKDLNSYLEGIYLKAFEEYGDARILSFAHKGAAPKIMAANDLFTGLDEMDEMTIQVLKKLPDINFITKRTQYELFDANKSYKDSPPFLNIALATGFKKDENRSFIRKIATVVEGIRDGVITKNDYDNSLFVERQMNNSPFCWYTNMMQQGATTYVPDIPQMNKLVEREKLKDFDKWNVDYQYKCVKNIIKHMTDDAEIDSSFKMIQDKDCPVYNSTRALNNILQSGLFLKNGFFRYFGES